MGVLSTHSNTLAITLGASAGIVAAIWAFKKYNNREVIPTDWVKIGEVTDLYCYPIKSCGPVKIQEIKCANLGFEKGLLRDRVFVVVDSETGKFVTGRRYPDLVLVSPRVEGSKLILTAPNMPEFTLDIDEVLKKSDKRRAQVWESTLNVVDCGDEVAQWFSRYVLKSETGLRLEYYPFSYPTKKIQSNDYKRWPTTTSPKHTGSTQDATSYMIMNQASVDELNKRLEVKVTPLQFRPNVVFKGLPAFGEDHIRWFRIGEKTVFKFLQPCLRCLFTTVDPETGIKNPNTEPLKTLKTFRRVEQYGDSPVLGVHLGVVVSDSIKVGDFIYVPN